MKPSWDTAPSWAKWLAKDSSGVWVWHENKPTFVHKVWQSSGLTMAATYEIDWRYTLEERPK